MSNIEGNAAICDNMDEPGWCYTKEVSQRKMTNVLFCLHVESKNSNS